MRIAVSGTHHVGKSTLVERLAEALPGYTTVQEPYFLLEEDGYESADPPSLEDFEAQLERSLTAMEEAGSDALFDRCPADILAYLSTLDAEGDADVERIRAAMQTLDLIVFVPIEERVPLPAHEDADHRRAVAEKLRELLGELGVEVISVAGNVRKRVDQVLARVASR